VGRSRDRGCNGHRILRRVLVGGRHLGLSRAISFHEAMVTATLAASSRGKAITLARAKAEKAARRRTDVPRKRERRQRCQRLDRIGRRGQRTSTLESSAKSKDREAREAWQRVSSCDPPKRDECREALGTLVQSRGAQDSAGCPRGESRGESRERTRYGWTHYHAGGRSRSDASRALPTGRSQGLVVATKQGASRKEARKHRLTRSTGREKAKRYAEWRSR